MTNSLRFLRGAARVIAILLTLSSLVPITFYVPDVRNWMHQTALTHFLPKESSWRRFEAFSPTSCQIYRLHIPFANETNLISDLTAFSLHPSLFTGTIKINGIMSHPQIVINKLNARVIEFYEGRFELSLSQQKSILRLNEWSAKGIHFDAEVTFKQKFQAQSGFVRGIAAQKELVEILGRWKIVPDAERELMRKFYIEWSPTHVSILLDGKPFFKAGWQYADSKD